MKKKNIIAGVVLGILLLLNTAKKGFAAPNCGATNGVISTSIKISPNKFVLGSIENFNVSFNTDANFQSGSYAVSTVDMTGRTIVLSITDYQNVTANSSSSFTISDKAALGDSTLLLADNIGVHTIYLANTHDKKLCKLGTYEILKEEEEEEEELTHESNCTFTISQERNGDTCYASGFNSCYEAKSSNSGPLIITTSGLVEIDTGEPLKGNVVYVIGEKNGGVAGDVSAYNYQSPGTVQGSFNPNSSGEYTLAVKEHMYGGTNYCNKTFSFTVKDAGECANECEEEPIIIDPGGTTETQKNFNLCLQVPSDIRGKCDDCFNAGGVWTSIGCINRTDADSMVGTFIKIGLNIAGGIALLAILAAAFMFATSEGEPKRTGEAKELLTNAIIGLIFIIFSITVLRFIGFSIFRLPEFGG